MFHHFCIKLNKKNLLLELLKPPINGYTFVNCKCIDDVQNYDKDHVYKM